MILEYRTQEHEDGDEFGVTVPKSNPTGILSIRIGI